MPTQFSLGDKVQVLLEAEVNKVKISQWVPGIVTTVKQRYDCMGDVITTYTISDRKPEEWLGTNVIISEAQSDKIDYR